MPKSKSAKSKRSVHKIVTAPVHAVASPEALKTEYPAHSRIRHSFSNYVLFLVIFSFVIPAIIAYILVTNYFQGNSPGTVLWQVLVLIVAFFVYVLIGWRKYGQHSKRHDIKQ